MTTEIDYPNSLLKVVSGNNHTSIAVDSIEVTNTSTNTATLDAASLQIHNVTNNSDLYLYDSSISYGKVGELDSITIDTENLRV
jgi:hypothetical protein